MFQQDAAHLPQGGWALFRAVKAREDGLRRGPVQVGTPERDDQVIGGVAGEPEGDRVVRHSRRHRQPADSQQERAIDPEFADPVHRRAPEVLILNHSGTVQRLELGNERGLVGRRPDPAAEVAADHAVRQPAPAVGGGDEDDPTHVR